MHNVAQRGKVVFFRGVRQRRFLIPSTVLFLIACAWLGFGREPHLAPGTSKLWDSPSEPVPQWKHVPRPEMSRSSQYLTMRDGVKLALDLYLPKALPAGTRIPALLGQTRYYRSVELRWPVSQFMQAPRTFYPEIFVENGYAFVALDTRGSGASFGHRVSDFSPDEVADGGEVVDWITAQTWSNGRVGAYGLSYGGVIAELLLTTHRPALKAAAILNGPYDMYGDIALPGGILYTSFLREWQRRNEGMDRNDIGPQLPFTARMALKGVRPVDSDASGKMLAVAIRDHEPNYRVFEAMQRVTFRDDPLGSGTPDTISPERYQDRIRATGVPTYSFSGWFDLGNNPRAAIARFLALSNPGSRLTIGPWNHALLQVKPGEPVRANPFGVNLEMLRFFDYHLKGIRGYMDVEQPIHYWTSGTEEWHSAKTWPPPGDRRMSYYLGPGHLLDLQPPHTNNTADAYRVDNAIGRGIYTRWETQNQEGSRLGYSGRHPDDGRLVVYESAVLSSAIEVTGIPSVALYIESTASDGQFFVYVEDVDPTGRITYVTEGLFRALHRKISSSAPVYAEPSTWHSFLRRDALPLQPGQPAKLSFDLIPTSYLFAAGHRIRVAFSGADRDHFDPLPGPPPQWKILRDSSHPSQIVLPVMSQ